MSSMFGNGYDADAWYGLHRYKLLMAVTGVNAETDADTRCGQGLVHGH